MRYRKKPVIVEAFQLGVDDFPKWAESALHDGRIKVEKDYVLIRTLEGIMRADKGVFIVKGVDDELYPCQAGIFRRTYERV